MEFKTIWNTHSPHLRNFILTKISDEMVADDILQDVGVKLYNNISEGKLIENHKNWLFQVSRNTIADYYRKQSRISTAEENYLDTPEKTYTSCPCDLVEFVIDKYLPKKYGLPLMMSDLKKMPQKEIAQVLDLSLENTKSRIQRGRKQLKKTIEGCFTIEYDKAGRIVGGHLKSTCQLPVELMVEIQKLNLQV